MLSRSKILKFPNYGLDDYDNKAIDKEIIRERYECLIELFCNADDKIIITSFRSIFYRIPQLNEISKSWKKIDMLTAFAALAMLSSDNRFRLYDSQHFRFWLTSAVICWRFFNFHSSGNGI